MRTADSSSLMSMSGCFSISLLTDRILMFGVKLDLGKAVLRIKVSIAL